MLPICLIAISLIAGCVVGRTENLPFLPNEIGVYPLWMPGICLAVKNINEVNAIMEAEKKADAEFAQKKNTVYFMERNYPRNSEHVK